MTDSTVDRMVRAATALLDSLDDDQRAAAHFPWPSEEERQRWFYTPTDHGGLPLTRMRPVQQQRTMQLLATGLSRAGYVTAATIMGLENVLDRVEDLGMTHQPIDQREQKMRFLVQPSFDADAVPRLDFTQAAINLRGLGFREDLNGEMVAAGMIRFDLGCRQCFRHARPSCILI